MSKDVTDGIKQLDIETKAKLLTGAGFWRTEECAQIGLPPLKLSDGPSGMRVQDKRPNHLGLGGSHPATCYPSASAVACSFNEELVERLGEHIGREACSYGVSMVLGPGLNIKRSPLCGRNFEYYSEDSYLSGKIAAAFVKGVQSTGVTACVKHFAANNREFSRMFYDSRVDEQTLRETYLTGFEIAVKEGNAGAVMTAYNRLNGTYCFENEYLLKTVLRGDWGFDGLVVSDWGGSAGRVEAVRAGADLEMPQCKFSAEEVINAVKQGELAESEVDRCVNNLVTFAHRSGNIENIPFDKDAHSDFAARVAEECLVLLKNEDGALPLKAGESVAVIGDFARKPRYQGAGSSHINPTSLADIWGVIGKTELKIVGFAKGFERYGGENKALIKRAVKLAKSADTLVVCLGLDENKEAEGCDRKDLNINENQVELLKVLAKLGKKIVVVLSCGSAVTTHWDKYANALLLAHLGGQSGAVAVVNALTGKVNPSGRLAESYPLNEESVPCAEIYSDSPMRCDYAEGIYVGYKYYSSFGVPVKYPFGYGLSYTDFTYSDFSVSAEGVGVTVTNTGKVAGAAVPQVYIKAPRANLQTSPSELKAFKKVFLQAGESVKVFMPFNEYSFRIWNSETSRFEAGGVYEVNLCTDCESKLFTGEVEITIENLPQGCAFAELSEGANVSKMSYREYFDSHISPDEQEKQPYKGMPVTLDMQVADLSYCKGLVAKIFGLIAAISKHSGDKITANSLDRLRLRSLLQFMGLSANQKRGFLLACDGHFFKGMKLLIFNK